MNLVVEAIPAKLGGILTYTRELSRTLPRLVAPEEVTLVAPREAVPHDAAPGLRLRPTPGGDGARATIGGAPVVRRALDDRPDPALFSSSNFTLQPRSTPQLLLMRNPVYFDPLYAEHVVPRLAPRERLMLRLRRNLCLASGEVASRVLTPTFAMRDLVVAANPGLAQKVEACHYGIDVRRFRAVAASRRPSPKGALRIVCHSIIGSHKPVWPIVAGVAEVRRRGVDATLTLVDSPFAPGHGTTPDIERERKLAQAGVDEGWLEITGRVAHDRMPALLAAHDVFAFHTVAESFGHPYVEAMASGLASVVTDLAVARELCGDAARYVPLFDARAFADRFDELAADPDLRARLGAKGEATVDAAGLTWERHFGRVAEILRALARGDTVPPASR